MNKKLGISILAVFVFVFIYEWLFHGTLMKETYLQTAHLWRPEAEMKNYFGWMLFGQFLVSFMFCFIFSKGYQNKGIAEGLRYGLYMGLFMSAPNFIMYAVAPYPLSMVMSWLVGGMVEALIAGFLVATVYKR